MGMCVCLMTVSAAPSLSQVVQALAESKPNFSEHCCSSDSLRCVAV